MGRRKSLEPIPRAPSITHAPDYAEPLRAWRLWEIEEVGAIPRLRSLYRLRFWPVGAPFVARCEAHRFRLRRRAGHAAPTETCSCGIYAVPLEFIRRLALHDRLPQGNSLVIGAVSLWGDVVECETGWRAGLAYPSRLFVPLACSDAEEKATGLADYGVPVELLDTSSVTDALDAVAQLQV